MTQARIAVDVMGGDYGTPVLVEGALRALTHADVSVELFLCGNRTRIESAFDASSSEYGSCIPRCRIVDCPEEIQSCDSPARVWKQKRKASIVRCISLQREGEVDASVSAGDTGILMSAALFVLGRKEGVSRPALGVLLPTIAACPCLLIDVGANVNSRGTHLVEFAHMGCDYFISHFGAHEPSVALLNIGEEPLKGTRALAQADACLGQRMPSGYRGYIEANQVLTGDVDVIVCNGFVGNVLLKAYESFYVVMGSVLRSSNKQLSDHLSNAMSIFNPERYGAAPLLGVNGIVLKAHGGSTATAFSNAVQNTIAHIHTI